MFAPQRSSSANVFVDRLLAWGSASWCMQAVTVSRDVSADPEAVRAAFDDMEAFMEAAGFDEVTVESERVTVARNIGLAELELTLELVESDADFACEQVEGMFDEMWTTYRVEADGEGATITAETQFELGGMIGSALDATFIKRQRRKELEDQLAYLDREATAE
jgi:carbon monoxide dehydrogenase subunit G